MPRSPVAFPSTILMNVIPAKLAGVQDIVLVTPPEADGSAGSTGVSGRVYWRRVMSAYRSLVPSCSR